MKWLITLSIAALLRSTQAQKGAGLTVRTQQGDVVGTFLPPGVRQYLGVPYAVANRWEAPATPPTRKMSLKATQFGDTCRQALTASNIEFLRLTGLSNSTIFVPESEDCLSVNIWAPSVDRKQKTAVLLWVYGGASQFGTSNLSVYDGQHVVRDNEDIIVVTFNYRLNIFGQPNAPRLKSSVKSQNFGLLDLDAAVKWVHDNIAAFGGDPERITLFGESAGGVAIDAYTFAYPQDTIVKGVIEQSGNLGLATDGGSTDLDPTAWNRVANLAGCGTNVTDAQFACMKAAPFRQLEDIVITNNIAFNSVVDNITWFSDINARAAAGNFLKVPLLVGSNAQEGDIFVVGAEEGSLGATIPVVTQLFSDILTAAFACTVVKAGGNRVNASVPTWRYLYEAVFPDISTRPDLRAYHSSEIPIIFGTYNLITNPHPTKEEVLFSKYVQKAWVAFARDPPQGLRKYGWPEYNQNTASVVELGGPPNRTGAHFSGDPLAGFLCANVGVLIGFLGSVLQPLGLN